ncbi:NIPA-like protein 2 [Lonchura striata]|uniref:NIPA-like protein 2 n=1 Tax=Lonchura striata TaxID=40157 RepID=A0A218UQW4_9PASE|nr:NIPA-like protein 2 [Lonchura striata domestica]
MRTNRRLMDRASYDDLVQSKLVLLGTTYLPSVTLLNKVGEAGQVTYYNTTTSGSVVEAKASVVAKLVAKFSSLCARLVGRDISLGEDETTSLTVIAVKAVSSMIALSVKGKMQLTYSVFYIMSVLMATSCAFQIKFLNQAMHLYEATAVVPINFVFFTTSAIISGVIFYREFQSATLLSMFMFLLGVVVFSFSHNISLGQKLTGKIQPDSHCSCYGTLNKEDDLVKRQS